MTNAKSYVSTKKPDIKVLHDILMRENVQIDAAIYIGDSLTKDMYMAKKIGITAAWANYQESNIDLYNKLVAISHWKEEDFYREKLLKKEWD